MNFRALTNSFAPMVNILTLIGAFFYGYFIFSSRFGFDFYRLIDLLVLVLLVYNILNSYNNTLFIVALVWLIGNYVFKLNRKSQIWSGYDGFTLVLLLKSFNLLPL